MKAPQLAAGIFTGGGHYPTSSYFISDGDFNALAAGSTAYTFVEKTVSVDANQALLTAAANLALAAGEKLAGLFGDSGGNFGYFDAADSPGSPLITRTDDTDLDLAGSVTVGLRVLSQDSDGFFLMAEQGEID